MPPTTIVDLFVGIGFPLIVGSLIVASVCSAVTYPVMRKMLTMFRPDKADGLIVDPPVPE